MFKRIAAISRKEIRQLKRDTRMLFVLFFFPLLLLVVFGYAVNFDVHHIRLAVYDLDKSAESRNFINRLTSSDYFDFALYIYNENEIKPSIEKNEAQCVIVFPEDFSKDLYSNKEAKIQVLIDGVNSNTASIIMNYMNIAVSSYYHDFSERNAALTGRKSFIPVTLEPLFWFNPDLQSTLFLIPGLIGMILIITAVVSISLSIVREKERGTIEQIHVSPLSSIELLTGKTLPYIIIALIISAIILFAGYILFGLVIKGSIFLLLITTLVFLFSALNLGIFVSSISNSQQIAFQIATLISMLPSVILSGFIFPIESMHPIIQIFTNLTPVKFYLIILRSIILKGVGLEAFWDQVLYLIIFGSVFLFLSSVINKKKEVE